MLRDFVAEFRMKWQDYAHLILVLLLICGGCASAFHEHHYFKSETATGEPINYYRISVDGAVLLSSSRYLSGYFNDDALNTYFGDYKQPANAHFDPSGAVPSKPADAIPNTSGATAVAKNGEKVESLGPQTNRRLVLLLSSNSDAIAEGLSSLSKSNDFTTALTNLVGAKRFEANQKAKDTGVQADDTSQVLIDEGKKTLDTLTGANPPDAKSAQAMVLNFANDLARFLGSNVEFTSLEEADRWLAANSARFNGGGQ
jgi:hypothetical protein